VAYHRDPKEDPSKSIRFVLERIEVEGIYVPISLSISRVPSKSELLVLIVVSSLKIWKPTLITINNTRCKFKLIELHNKP